MLNLPMLVDRTYDTQKRAGLKCRLKGMKGDLEHYNGTVCDAEVNRGSTSGWLVKPGNGTIMVLSDKNMEWTRCEDTFNIEDNYSRSTTTGRNTTSCRTAMRSVCSQFRGAVKKKYAAAHSKTQGFQGKKIDDDEYGRFIHTIFEQFDLDGNKSIDKDEFLSGLFSLGVQITGEEAGMIMSMFGAANAGFTYTQFCQVIISDDATRRKKSSALPALQREDTLARMNNVSKATRKKRIKHKTALCKFPGNEAA
jgi:hypothetical protein